MAEFDLKVDCPYCKKIWNADKQKKCPHCGAPYPTNWDNVIEGYEDKDKTWDIYKKFDFAEYRKVSVVPLYGIFCPKCGSYKTTIKDEDFPVDFVNLFAIHKNIAFDGFCKDCRAEFTVHYVAVKVVEKGE